MVKTRMLSAKGAKGFTLIELMIAIAILGILLAIAVPSYTQYLRESRRAEAQSEMLQIRLGLEKWRANNNTYTSNLGQAGFTDNNDFYNYDISNNTGSTYTINARAQGSQTADVSKSGVSCTPLTLDQSGTKGPAGCWKK